MDTVSKGAFDGTMDGGECSAPFADVWHLMGLLLTAQECLNELVRANIIEFTDGGRLLLVLGKEPPV